MHKVSRILLLAAIAAALPAAPLVYMVTQGVSPGINGNSLGNCPTQDGAPCGSYLALLNPTLGTATSYNPVTNLLPNEEIFDIATNSLGEIYAVSNTSLYRINAATAVASLIGAITGLGVPTLNSLAFDPNGVLYAAGGNGNIYTLDAGTAAATNLGTWATGGQAGFQAGGDIAFVGARLFLANNNNQIVEVNPLTGALLQAGPSGLGGNIQTLKGLAQADGTGCGSLTATCLYVAADFNGGGGTPNISLVDIGLSFGNIIGTDVAILPIGNSGPIAFGFPAGLSDVSAVPEPSVVTLSALGLAMLAWSRRKRS